MNPPFFSRDEVATRLGVPIATLLRYEQRGLVQVGKFASNNSSIAGYDPVMVRRLWTIVSFQRDLGINLAGGEVILRLRDQLDVTHQHLGRLARDLQSFAELDADGPIFDGEIR